MAEYKFKKLSLVESESDFTSDTSQHLIVEDGGGIKRLEAEERLLPKVEQTDDGKVPMVEDGRYVIVDIEASDVDYTSNSSIYATAPTNVDEALKGVESAVNNTIADAVADWLDENITQPTTPVIDASLTVSGAAADAKATGDAVGELKSQISALDDTIGVYDLGTKYNTLNPTYSRVMAIYPIKDVNSIFNFAVTNKSTNGTLSIRICSNPTPYSADLLENVGSMGADMTELSGSFQISEANKASAKYIIFLNATANLVVSFDVTLWTSDSVEGELKAVEKTANFLNDATLYGFEQYEQGGMNGLTGADAASPATVRTALISIFDISKVSLATQSGLHVQLYSYGEAGNYLGRNDLGVVGFSYIRDEIRAYRSGAVSVKFAIYLDGGGNFSPADLKENGSFVLSLTSVSAIPKMNQQTNTQFENLLKTVGRTPMASWVDDDGVVVHTNGGINGVVLPVAEDVGIPVTFGLIPPLTESVTIEGVTMTKAEYFQNLQKQGHQMVAHPEHTHWYGNQFDLTKVNPTLIECLTELQANGFLRSDMLIYPGSSGANADVVEIVRKWCVCGVLSGYGTPNHLGDSTKWGIKRTFVNFADYNSLHSGDAGYVSAMAWYKSQVDSAYDNGDWIVFGTHSYQFTESDDTSDPNANTRGNLKMLMQYAVTKGLEFRTLWDAYNRRKYLFDFNEINR